MLENILLEEEIIWVELLQDSRGGGHKHKYSEIDFYRKKDDIKAKIERIEYDPNRSAYVALIKYEDGIMNYILAP